MGVGRVQRRRGGRVGARGLEQQHELAAAGESVQHAAQQLLIRVKVGGRFRGRGRVRVRVRVSVWR